MAITKDKLIPVTRALVMALKLVLAKTPVIDPAVRESARKAVDDAENLIGEEVE